MAHFYKKKKTLYNQAGMTGLRVHDLLKYEQSRLWVGGRALVWKEFLVSVLAYYFQVAINLPSHSSGAFLIKMDTISCPTFIKRVGGSNKVIDAKFL